MIVFIAFLSAFFVSHSLFAQEMRQGRDRDQFKIHQKLNLTEEKQEKDDIMKLAHQKEMVDLKANLEKKEIEMAELKNKGSYTREDYLNKIMK